MEDRLVERVREILHNHKLGQVQDIGAATDTPTIGSEATAQTVRVQTDDRVFLVKVADHKGLDDQTRYHITLASKLPLPSLVASGSGYQVFEWIENTEPLLRLVSRDDSTAALRWYRKAAEHLTSLWGNCEMEGGGASSGHYVRNREAEERLRVYFGTGYHLPLIVNGQPTGTNIAALFAAILDTIAKPLAITRLTHGDPRFDNILITSNGDVVFIDVRPGFPDWVDDLALFAWQRGFRVVKFTGQPTVCHGTDMLSVTYEVNCPSWIGTFEMEALEMADNFGRHVKDSGWRQRYYYAVAACALREITSIRKRRAIGALGRELPEGAEGFWIGESLRYFARAQEEV